jgi:pSer/pThr/pTyr-binding forkhead associated (FHA) protein
MNLNASTEFGLVDGRPYIIGREGHIRINSPSVSKQHAEMTIKNRRVYLRDLNSTNGTYLVIDDRLVRLDKGYVDHYQPIMIGRVKCTLWELLAIICDNSDSKITPPG